jgi:hypothetical protein
MARNAALIALAAICVWIGLYFVGAMLATV